MSLSPKILSLCAGVGVGCVGIPLAFSQTTNSSDSAPAQIVQADQPSQDVSSPVPSEPKAPTVPISAKEEEDGNCKLIEMPLEFSDILFSFDKNKNNYYTISCTTNTGVVSILGSSTDWTGVFPKSLFLNGNTLREGSKIEVQVKITPLEEGVADYNRLVFESNKFASLVSGVWMGEEQKSGTKNIRIINITDPRNSDDIYLSFN
ncbi:hypothetical protein OVS_03200 [Mycoplasma ovis str. Michigan]|uniref:Lipoprotein n=1 Tax=Mycoplasma ovis str. Michigan TaxID=1415773 RepID=A0ABN4BLX0_9MOLU|nr:hypothetical protein [Mycoplasma ovis]AHC40393.1 hypothetical protein OVS_03200 [Mycoplasma ovis str. Michigan]